MTKLRCITMTLALFFTQSGQEAGATVRTASSPSQKDIETQYALSSDGDIIDVPAGSATWTNLALSKAIWLRGAGTNLTIINCAHEGTNIFTKQTTGPIRISGFQIVKSNAANNEVKGFILKGQWPSGQPIIFETNWFIITNTGMFLIATPGGTIFSQNSFRAGWDDSMLQYKAVTDSNSWTTADTFGARDTNGYCNHYVENNNIIGGANQFVDWDDNTRGVWRNNVSLWMCLNSHGHDTSPFGVRHMEVYGNTFNFTDSTAEMANVNQSIWFRGGTWFVYSNFMANLAGNWGEKPEFKFNIRGAEDVRPQGACGSVSYPIPEQLGQSHDGATSTTDPVRWYSNTGTIGISAGFNWGNPCSFTFTTFWETNRDYIGEIPKGGYTAYTNPHPLVASAQAQGAPPNIPILNAQKLNVDTLIIGQ